MSEPEFYISEYFESLQGEGNFSGVKSLFIRFHYCNLTCSWCDTKYTWNRYSGNHKLYTTDQVQDIIREHDSYHVIFTGGEPSLYRLDLLAKAPRKFHVETNGSIIPTESVDLRLPDGTLFQRDPMDEQIISGFNWVVSPKLSNAHQKVNEKSIAFWAQKKWGIFKFIAKSERDLFEIETFTRQFDIDKRIVYVGIEGASLESQLNPELTEEILAHGFNFSPRLHVILWGNIRGK